MVKDGRISSSEHHFGEFSCFDGFLNRSKHEHSRRAPVRQTEYSSNREMKETEDFLASELSKLSIQEISKALDDVHCVGEELKEDEEMIQRSLAAFDEAVRAQRNPIYDIAAGQNRAYIEDPSFRLKFLRANLHDVQRSVRQMMSFLKYKATYFGEDTLGRDIVLSDLKQEDVDHIQSGLFHIQAGRDRSGRVITYIFNHIIGQCKVETQIRAAYYIWFNIILDLPDVQTKGLVGIYYDIVKPEEKMPMPGLNFMLTLAGFTSALPIRYSSMHFCLKTGSRNLALNNAVLGKVMNAFPQYSRVRTRLHYGSDMELQYQLQGHGVPLNFFPVGTRGDLRKDMMNIWYEQHLANMDQSRGQEAAAPGVNGHAIKSQRELAPTVTADLESDVGFTYEKPLHTGHAMPGSNSVNNVIWTISHGTNNIPGTRLTPLAPNPNDILLGRGILLQKHPGNIRFREWLEGYRDVYNRTPRNEKRRLATAIMRELIASDARFLRQNEYKQWVAADPLEAEEKICQLFRSIRKK